MSSLIISDSSTDTDESTDVDIFLSTFSSSHFDSSDTHNTNNETVHSIFQQVLQQRNEALSTTLSTIMTTGQISSGAYCSTPLKVVPLKLGVDLKSVIDYRRDTPFTNPKFRLKPHSSCNHTPKDMKNAEATIKYLNIARESLNSSKYSFAQLPEAGALSHSLYFDRLCRILHQMYKKHGNGTTACEVCFYGQKKLWKTTSCKYNFPLMSSVHVSITYAVWNCSHYSEFGLWKARRDSDRITFAQSMIGWVGDLDTESDGNEDLPEEYELPEDCRAHPDFPYQKDNNHLHHYNHDCEDNEHILGCFTQAYAPLQSPSDVMDLYDVQNLSAYSPQTYLYNISLITAALNCQNYEAFDMFLFKCQELHGYVSPSILYDILECQEYQLYNYITDYNQKFDKSLINDILQSPNDQRMVKKYAHITFTPQSLDEEGPQIAEQINHSVSPPIGFLPSNPITYQTTLSLLTTQLVECAKNPIPNPTQLSYLASLLHTHINLVRTRQLSHATQPSIEGSTAVQYLQQYYPQIIPFHNIMNPASIAYLSCKHLYAITHTSPYGNFDFFSQAKVNPAFRPVLNEFLMSRFAAPVLTKYLWLIEILTLPFDYIGLVAQNIPNLSEFLGEITMKEFYTILLHQPILFIAKWLYIIASFVPNYLRDVSSQQSSTPRDRISSFNQSYENSNDRDLLVTLLSDFLRYAMGYIFPLIWVQGYGWCYASQKEVGLTLTHLKRSDYDLSVCVLTQRALNSMMVFYTHPDPSGMDNGMTQARVSSSFPIQHAPMLRPDDIILLRQLVASLFFPVTLPSYHDFSEISNLTGDTSSFCTTQPLLDPCLHLDLFGMNQVIDNSIHWSRSQSDEITVRSLMSAYLPTFTPSLWCFLFNYYIISPLCRVRLPKGTPNTIGLQLALKSRLISHMVRQFLAIQSVSFNGYHWTLLMRCSDLGNDNDHNIAFESTPIQTGPWCVEFKLQANKIVSSRRLLKKFPQYKDYLTDTVNLMMDDIITSHVTLSILTEPTPSTLLTVDIPSNATLNDLALKLYNINLSLDIAASGDPCDYYSNILKILKLNTVDEFHCLVGPYGQSEIKNGSLVPNPNAKLPVPSEQSEKERNNVLGVPLLNPFASLLYQYQPMLYTIDTLEVRESEIGITQLCLDQLFHTYKDFINVEIDLRESRTPTRSSFAQHILNKCCNVNSFAQIPHNIYQQFLLPVHNNISAIKARDDQLCKRLVSYGDKNRLSAGFDIDDEIEAPPSLFLFLLKSLSISVRSIMLLKRELLMNFNGQLPLYGLLLALLEACVNEYTSQNRENEPLVFVERTFISHYDDIPISCKQYGEVSANYAENQIELVLKEYAQFSSGNLNPTVLVKVTPKLFYRTYPHDSMDIASIINTVTHPITREQISLLAHPFFTSWDLGAIFNTLEMERKNGTVLSIIQKTRDIPPLSLFNADHSGINPIFSKIDTIERFWLYYCAVDPLIKPFFDNIQHFFVDSPLEVVDQTLVDEIIPCEDYHRYADIFLSDNEQ